MRRVPWRGIGEGVGLTLALIFVFSVQFIPHLGTFEDPPPEDQNPLVGLGGAMAEFVSGERDGYPWAIHVDEHFHASMITRTQQENRLTGWAPYQDNPGTLDGFTGMRSAVHERGYHTFWAEAEELTGLSHYDLYRFFPAVWMTFVAFAVYALMRPNPAAIPAAAFVGLVPTTVRFLGTGFLVPIGFSMAWLPVVAILLAPARKRAVTALLLLMVTAWAFFVHLIAGFACVAILGIGALASSGKGRRATLTLLALSLLPVAWLYRTFTGDVEGQVAREETLPIDWSIFDSFGLILLGLWALGLALLALDPPEENAETIQAFGGLSAFALALIVGGRVFEWGTYATYTRWHPPFFLAAAVPAGYGLAVIARRGGQILSLGAQWVGKRWRPAKLAARTTPLLAIIAGVLVTTTALSTPVGHHTDEQFYRVMDDIVWADYQRAAEVAGPEHEVFLAHPWQAPFFTEMTGKIPYSVLRPGGPPSNSGAWTSYLQGEHDLAFYILNDISLVIGPRNPYPGVFEERAHNVWTLPDDVTRELAEIRAAERAAKG